MTTTTVFEWDVPLGAFVLTPDGQVGKILARPLRAVAPGRYVEQIVTSSGMFEIDPGERLTVVTAI